MVNQGHYIKLLTESQIFFLNDHTTDVYKQCIKDLNEAQFIGLDTEYTPQFNMLNSKSQLCLI